MTKKIKDIKLVLYHDFLQISNSETTINLPIRAARLIKDMYELRNAEHEELDILQYSEGYHNYGYDLHIFVMNSKYLSSLQWVHKKVKPFTRKDFAKLKKGDD